MESRMRAIIMSGLTLLMAVTLAACASAGVTTVVVTATPQASATPQPVCVQLAPGAAPFTSINGVAGLTLAAGGVLTSGVQSGGGAGQYQVMSYTGCFQGSESAIDGMTGSTIAQLKQAGWGLYNLFPDPTNNAYMDNCSNSHNCLNSTDAHQTFSFVGFDQYASHVGGYTTFRIQVATIAAPSCLNDPQYYTGTPTYTLYYDGSIEGNHGNPQFHFQMPPGTRVSTFQGGGTAGSTYVYYCSAGTQASVVQFLDLAMSSIGWTVSGVTATGFTATFGTSPAQFTIAVNVQNPNNYYLRVFVPM